jgi:hypothetical protein
MADPLASLASALPAALGTLPMGGLGAGLDPLSSLAGTAAPLAGLMSQLADQPRHDAPSENPSNETPEDPPPKPNDGESPKQAEPQ